MNTAANWLLLDVAPDWGLHTYWYLGRAAGFVAMGVLFISVALGLCLSSRLFDGLLTRAWFFELHRFTSLFVIAVVLFHALIMLPDRYAGFTVDDLLLPFRADIKTGAMALGILTLYALVIVSSSFFVTRWIGQKTWRALHYGTFLAFFGGTIHGVWAGTDTQLVEVRVLYLALFVLLSFLVLYRILALRSARKPPAPARLAQAGRGTSQG